MQNLLVPIPDKCSGCMSCMLICSWKKENKFNPLKARIKVVEKPRKGMSIPILCMQCAKPACMESCPVGAISRKPETGAMIIDGNTCVGCKQCMLACPYGAIRLDPENGSMLLCNLCDGNPACVKVCRFKALQWVPKTRVDAVLKASVVGKLMQSMKDPT